jgi:NACHT domain
MEEPQHRVMDLRQSYASSTPIDFIVNNCFPGFAAGCGKSVLWYVVPSCLVHRLFIPLIRSAIIEDLRRTMETPPALIAYYYFDSQDRWGIAQYDLRGLLSSLLTQLSSNSSECLQILFQLHMIYRDGSQQPSEESLVQCLRTILDLPQQFPNYVIIDALDECSDSPGFPSARKKVLDFMTDLIRTGHPNLHLCITSRPEQDIQSTLNPLASRRVSLYEERGQREDINNYIRYFVRNNNPMRKWREEDKELVVTTLSERAHGM